MKIISDKLPTAVFIQPTSNTDTTSKLCKGAFLDCRNFAFLNRFWQKTLFLGIKPVKKIGVIKV